ncbi:tRNA lysidine(34) synthetase TilS [Hyphobacterium marinum]|uniref:tRNA(Ile)-lysidine synthase n=1 Tax=Hyphobacterium marinum TaxID=3116574 RepID=A0ABU7LXW1_9PROT|nr:tRNA lysidine(34) synthetase TilS [Hyphobacterium sp. Y6023]MEE2566404.1 tRNA lysidine(34) synthetase TilS [Hyphobacterium sp. Y6023]
MPLTPHFNPGSVRDRLDRLVPATGPVLIGYSGGGDSHALMLIASDWARQRNRTLEALIVDHGLRAESRAEAEQALAAANKAQCLARILTCPPYQGQGTGLQDWARTHRYRAFGKHALETGATALLLAHTADDQAETVWMRLLAGAGWRGLAAMGEDDAFPGDTAPADLRVLRPLLDTRRQALRDWLAQKGERWVEDNSNADRRFTRVRIRQSLGHLEASGFSPSSLRTLAASCRALGKAIDEESARVFEDTVRVTDWGVACLKPDALVRQADPVLRRLLEAAITTVTGAPGPHRAQGLEALLAGLKSGRSATGAGVVLHQTVGTAWLIRDPGAVLGRAGEAGFPPLNVEPNQPAFWDRRFQISTDRPVSVCAWDQLPESVDRTGIDLSAIPPLARRTLPVAHDGGTVLAIPGVVSGTGVTMTHCGDVAVRRSLFSGRAPAWFDDGLQVKAG